MCKSPHVMSNEPRTEVNRIKAARDATSVVVMAPVVFKGCSIHLFVS